MERLFRSKVDPIRQPLTKQTSIKQDNSPSRVAEEAEEAEEGFSLPSSGIVMSYNVNGWL
jgi:hypothetical protein